MDDLSKLQWSSSLKATENGQPSKPPMTAPYPAFQPSSSNRSVQPPKQGHDQVNGRPVGSKPTSRSSTPSNDSFSNLVSFGSSKGGGNVSLLERQRQLAEEKSRRESEQGEKLKLEPSIWENQFWDNLGQAKNSSKDSAGQTASLRKTPLASRNASSTRQDFADHPAPKITSNDEDDLLSAFLAAAPVDSSTHFPPPSVGPNDKASRNLAESQSPRSGNGTSQTMNDDPFGGDPSDPFGLGPSDPKPPPSGSRNTLDNEDDILGLLSRPVNATSTIPSAKSIPSPARSEVTSEIDTGPEQKAVSELVEMGFPVEKAKEALLMTETGLDVQAAVGWLLDAAHREAKERQKPQRNTGRDTPGSDNNEIDEPGNNNGAKPAWMRQNNRPGSGQSRSDHRSPMRGDKDITHVASDIGSNLLKSANNIWKTSKRTVRKAVDELQHDGDPSQPKWMREAQQHETMQGKRALASGQATTGKHKDEVLHPKASEGIPGHRDEPIIVTEEALMLEGNTSRPQARQQLTTWHRTPSPGTATSAGMTNNRSMRQPDRLEEEILRSRKSSGSSEASTHQISSAKRLNRAATEEESMQAYISPARRRAQNQKSATYQPPSSTAPNSNQETISAQSSTISMPVRPGRLQEKPSRPSSAFSNTTPIPVRPVPPTRAIPSTSAAALASSLSYRGQGSEAFKKGDYTAAEVAYTRALSTLPSGHPTAIVILCNRSLVNLKNGDPKAAIADAERALTVIGVSRGEGEKISLGVAEGDKDMHHFFVKALIRKAESLEQLEKWKEAADAWRQAVETGLGGAISIQGRDRCESAARKSTRAQSPARQHVPAVKAPSSTKTPRPHRSVVSTIQPSEAVERLRQANEEAEKVDDEKFALADSVDARVEAWKSGKQDNIRALLVSLDTVLWPEAGWKKVGMHELVMANKVKIIYMKGIAKVHPDKLPVTATTEQRMISGAVFGILNEAWDKFRAENNL